MEKLTYIAVILLFVSASHALYFQLPVNTEKCMREEIHKDVLVTGEYDISDQNSVTVDLRVSFFILEVGSFNLFF